MTSVRTSTRTPPSCGRPGPRPTRRRAGSNVRVPLRRRRRRQTGWQRWWPAALIAVAVLAAVSWQGMPSSSEPAAAAPARCTVPGASFTLTPDQAANATAIAVVARARRLPDRALVIALATAEQESHLRNLPYGDRDSLGLFQQRPSQGWGTPEQILDPHYSAGRFFDHLVGVPGWQTARLTDVAQTVQRSAAPEAYQKWEPTATELARALNSGTVRCPG